MKSSCLIPLLIFSSCSLAPDYMLPVTEVPLGWKSEISENSIPVNFQEPWWFIFNDDYLNQIEASALEKNPNLATAAFRVFETRSIAYGVYGDLFPQIFLQPSTQNTGSLVNTFFGLGISREHFQQYIFPLSGSYEIDVFGRLRNNYNAFVHDSEAVFYDYETVKLTLTTDIAFNYFRMRGLDSQILVLKNTIQSRQDAFDVNSARYEAGLVNFSDVSRASNLLSSAKADLYAAEISRAEVENILATLLGTNPTDYHYPFNPLLTLAPKAAPLLPSSLLQMRPDVASAEKQIQAATDRIGVARTEFFPTFDLTGAIGFSSPDLDRLFNWKSRLWSWGSTVAQLIFDGGKAQANVDTVTSRFWETMENYIATVLTAFQEAETAIISENLRHQVFFALNESVLSAQDTRAISQERYLQGLVTYLDVVDAESTLLSDQLRMERARIDTYIASIQLIKAMGGGFKQCSENGD